MLMRADVLTNRGILLVVENSDIQEWTFESIEEDKYRIKTTVEGAEKYLCINKNGNVTLVDESGLCSVIQATPGSGTNSGKWHFTVDGYSLNFYRKCRKRTLMRTITVVRHLAEPGGKIHLTEDDFVKYSARKISASDDSQQRVKRMKMVISKKTNKEDPCASQKRPR